MTTVGGIVPMLQNIVTTVNLDSCLDLKPIALHARSAEYNPKDPKTTVLIFASGKTVVTGAKSEDDSRLASRKYARIIQKLRFDAKFSGFKIRNIVSSCDVSFPIHLEGLAYSHGQFSSYEPELFPGLIYRMIKLKVVLLIFVSGKIVLAGAKTRLSTPIIVFFLSVTANSTRPICHALRCVHRARPRHAHAQDRRLGRVLVHHGRCRLSLVAICVVSNVTAAQANTSVLPFLDYVHAITANSSPSGNPEDVLELGVVLTTQFGSFYEWYNAVFKSGSQETHENVVQMLMGIEGGFSYYFVAGSAVSKVPALHMELNPAWQCAAAHVVIGTIWLDSAKADEINQVHKGLKAKVCEEIYTAFNTIYTVLVEFRKL